MERENPFPSGEGMRTTNLDSQRDIDAVYKSEQEEHDKNNKKLASDMDIWKKLGYISDDD